MKPPKGYSREGNDVIVRVSRADWTLIMMVNGMGTGLVRYDEGPQSDTLRRITEAINRANQGNPDWEPVTLESLERKDEIT